MENNLNCGLRMKIKKISVFYLLFFLITTNISAQSLDSLHNQRLKIIKQYIELLGKGDYESISHLFIKNGLAVSSSGKMDNPSHFYKTLFTKTISNPDATLINIFEGRLDLKMMTAYFNYSWNNTAGKRNSAKFLDLFIFQRNTAKIKTVLIFSNTFQQDIMKQLDHIPS